MKKFFTTNASYYRKAMNNQALVTYNGCLYQVRLVAERFNERYGCMMGYVELVSL